MFFTVLLEQSRSRSHIVKRRLLTTPHHVSPVVNCPSFAGLESYSPPVDFKEGSLESSERDVLVVSGSSLSLPCNVKTSKLSSPVIKFEWHRSGKMLQVRQDSQTPPTPSRPGYTLLPDGTLILNHITTAAVDGHSYRCQASSPEGRHTAYWTGSSNTCAGFIRSACNLFLFFFFFLLAFSDLSENLLGNDWHHSQC